MPLVIEGHTIEGGHSGSANSAEQAYLSALAYTFLWKQLQ